MKTRNFVVKHDFNRGGAHRSAKDYNRKWEVDMDEVDEVMLKCPECIAFGETCTECAPEMECFCCEGGIHQYQSLDW